MTRLSVFSSPLLLGFDELERMLDRASKTAGDGYPPYNIERLARAEGEAERLRITLAVAGFSRDENDVTVDYAPGGSLAGLTVRARAAWVVSSLSQYVLSGRDYTDYRLIVNYTLPVTPLLRR